MLMNKSGKNLLYTQRFIDLKDNKTEKRRKLNERTQRI